MSAMRTRILSAVCVLLLLVGELSALPTCVLKGRVRDAWTGEPLVGASVVIRGTEYGNATDLKGDYVVIRLPEMTGTATAACVGYDDTSALFSTTATCTTRLDFSLHRVQPVAESPSRPVGPRPKSLPLPVNSESRFQKSWGCFARSEGLLAIEQIGDSVLIQVFGGGLPDQPKEYQSGMREGRIAISEFQTFWDSLNQLRFWRLRDEYAGHAEMTGEEGGSVSVSYKDSRGAMTSKTIRYFVPRSCTLEFRRVYDLITSMARYAQTVPDWRTLLRYDTAPPIREFGNRYHSAVPLAIAAIRDSQDLDTLLTMLAVDDQHVGAVIGALGSIGSKRAVPTLEEYIARREAEPTQSRRYDLIGDAAKALFAVNGTQSAPTIRRLLNSSCPPRLVYTLSEMLAGAGDYSGVPAVVKILSGPARGEVTWAAEALKQIGHGSQMAISALLQVAESELKADKPDDRIMKHIYMTLAKLTSQEFIYRPEDPLSVRRSSMAGWLKWWQTNAKSFPSGYGGGPVGGYGFIQVNSTPPGAAISLDGSATGKTTPFLLLGVAEGEHDLRLTKERHADWTSRVTATRGRTTTVRAGLSPVFGRLQIGSVPAGAVIWLDGDSTGKTTPYLFARIPADRHRLRLGKTWYNYWDSTVTVVRDQTTVAEAMLKAPPESVWATYAKPGNPGWATWVGPERSVKFDPRDFGFGYPLFVGKVSAEFYLLSSFPWRDSSFSFRIYGGDGQTLLYKSPMLEAVTWPAVVHELSAPIRLDSGAFYVSVVPADTSGRPTSLATSSYKDERAPSVIPWTTPADSIRRSYTGSPGHWTFFDRGEFSISVLLQR